MKGLLYKEMHHTVFFMLNSINSRYDYYISKHLQHQLIYHILFSS